MINWEVRYKKIVDIIKLTSINDDILEIGSGPVGISHYIPNNIIGLEYSDVESKSTNLTVVKGDVRNLEFSDGAFPVVVCSDVLEHLDYNDRNLAISECIRVSSRFVFIQNPSGYIAYEAEKYLAESLNDLNWNPPNWLCEHLENGFPNASSIAKASIDNGYLCSIHVNEFVLQHYSSIFLDIFFKGSKVFSDLVRSKEGICYLPGVATDVPYSLLYIIDKSKPYIDNRLQEILAYKRSELCNASVVNIYSVFDRYLDISEKFKSIIPFYVKNELGIKTSYEVKSPTGFLESTNERSSEITAIHYILKNYPSTPVIGFCHYRRYLDLCTIVESKCEEVVHHRNFDSIINKIDNNGLVLDLLEKYDLLIGTPISLTNTIENQYLVSHYSSDYYNLYNVVSLRHPYLIPFFHESMDSTFLYGSNLVIGRSDLVKIIFGIVFDCLEPLESINDTSTRTQYQKRDIAFLSERIFDVIIRFMNSNSFDIKILNRYFIKFD